MNKLYFLLYEYVDHEIKVLGLYSSMQLAKEQADQHFQKVHLPYQNKQLEDSIEWSITNSWDGASLIRQTIADDLLERAFWVKLLDWQKTERTVLDIPIAWQAMIRSGRKRCDIIGIIMLMEDANIDEMIARLHAPRKA